MASPERGYERPAESLGRSGHAAVAVVVVFAVFLALVTVKPWGGTVAPLPTTTADAPAEPPIARASIGGPNQPPRTEPAPTPPWPATPAGVPPRTSTAATDARLDDFGRRAGTWGVWVAGAGPRLIREEAWSDWVAVHPEPSDGAPSHVATWPGTDVCERLPVLPGRPSVVAVTAPGPLPAGARIEAWWTDGARVASLAGSIGYLSPGRSVATGSPGRVGGPLLVRVDGGTWPAGRYELHVAGGSSTTALTFCLGPIG